MSAFKYIAIPLEIWVQVAFFIEDWQSLAQFLEALRFIKGLGPLEHIWQLSLSGWKAEDLWPSLNLAKVDDASRVHLEGIARFYSILQVDYKTDLDWFRQRIYHVNCKIWMESCDLNPFDAAVFARWSEFRITSLRKPWPYINCNLVDGISSLKFLVSLYWHKCTPAVSMAIVDIAASSGSLRKLRLWATTCERGQFCTVTPTMATGMRCYTWATPTLRNDVVAAALKHNSLETLQIDDTGMNPDLQMIRRRHIGALLDVDNLIPFICLFGFLIATKINVFLVSGLDCAAYEPVWTTLLLVLQQAQTKNFHMNDSKLSTACAIQMAEIFRHHPTLEEVTVCEGDMPSFNVLVTLLNGASSTLKKLGVASSEEELLEAYSEDEVKCLQALALERSIYLFFH
ncbi:hypothetical protein LEN26_002957 [Aphanomyces euteiches]|nr:hypothetical protein AeMF1_017232 [Aphanomyces euteiches]KAH9158471.1 hypothetical protein LEN26_002957 [Aphanomyces euteiches]KAH9182737.1 hypothetical protein AeNC1_015287 [Aphanomyces euteiches]